RSRLRRVGRSGGSRRRGAFGPRAVTGLERQRLRAAVDLGAATGVEGRDRGAGKRVVRGEQPAERLVVLETAVEQHRQRARQPLDDRSAVEEGGRDRAVTAWAGDGEELTVAEELLYPADGQTKPCGYLRK